MSATKRLPSGPSARPEGVLKEALVVGPSERPSLPPASVVTLPSGAIFRWFEIDDENLPKFFSSLKLPVLSLSYRLAHGEASGVRNDLAPGEGCEIK